LFKNRNIFIRLMYIIIVNLLFIEILSFLLFEYEFVLTNEMYRDGWFDCGSCRKSIYNPRLGWDNPYPDGIRPPYNIVDGACGAAFGDSFTHGDEVSDSEAWPRLLSDLLGCEIFNYGVGGYGQDQALSKYEMVEPNNKYVFIGINQEMMRRNFAASNRFYGGEKNSFPKPYYVLEDGKLTLISPPGALQADLIKKHHDQDRYYTLFDIHFPYFISLAKVIFNRIDASSFRLNRIMPREIAWTLDESVEKSRKILDIFVANIRRDGMIPVVILFPDPHHVHNDQKPYKPYMDSLRRDDPELCIVDPFESLRVFHEKQGMLNAPYGHFNGVGNAAIASAVYKAVKETCPRKNEP
jgi:hypothetical protein